MASFAQWLQQSVGEEVPQDVAGVLVDWQPAGEIAFDGSAVNVRDLWGVLDDYCGTTLDLPAGTYAVEGQGVEYGGHRRVAAVRVRLADRRPTAMREVGQVLIDSWGVAIGHIDVWHAALPADAAKEFEESNRIGIYVETGCDVSRLDAGTSTLPIARAFTGLGSGGYSVFALLDERGLPVGVLVQFISKEDASG